MRGVLIMRIHELAKANGVKSMSVVYVLNLVKPRFSPHLGLRYTWSPSHRVEIDRDNRLFWETVVAKSRLHEARSKRISTLQN